MQFAFEFHWTPEQVWDLELWQLVEFSRALDRLAADRKKAAKGKR